MNLRLHVLLEIFYLGTYVRDTVCLVRDCVPTYLCLARYCVSYEGLCTYLPMSCEILCVLWGIVYLPMSCEILCVLWVIVYLPTYPPTYVLWDILCLVSDCVPTYLWLVRYCVACEILCTYPYVLSETVRYCVPTVLCLGRDIVPTYVLWDFMYLPTMPMTSHKNEYLFVLEIEKERECCLM